MKSKRVSNRITPPRQKYIIAMEVLSLLLWTGVSVIISQLIMGNIMLLFMPTETFRQPAVEAIFTALSYVVALFLVVWVPIKLKDLWQTRNKTQAKSKTTNKQKSKIKLDRASIGLRGLPTWTDIGLAPIGFVVSLILSAGLTWLFMLFPWFDAGEIQDVGFSYYVTGLKKVIAFTTLVVIAPIAEEIIFRGWLYGRIREKISCEMSEALSIILASLLVSILFGIVHLQWNVGVNVFALSLVLCVLREITGTIYAGILTHMIKNGVAFYLLYVLV